MVTINLHGALRELLLAAFPDTTGSLQLAVTTPVEALVALMRQVPGFEAVMRSAEFRLATPDLGDLSPELAKLRFGKNAVLDIHPVAAGAGIELSAYAIAAIAFSAAALIYALTFNPTVGDYGDREDEFDNRASYLADGAVNSQAQGGAVPLIYGRFLVGSRLVSGGIYSSRIPYIAPPPPPAPPPPRRPDRTPGEGGGGRNN